MTRCVMLKTFRLALILASFVGASTLAAAASAPEQKSKEGDRIICKRQAPTGTRFAKKTCRSKKELEEIAEQHKRDASEMVNRPVVYSCTGPAC
jgi:hypothetical protein